MNEPDGWVVVIKDKGAPRGYWFVGAYTVKEWAEKDLHRNKGAELVAIYFGESHAPVASLE